MLNRRDFVHAGCVATAVSLAPSSIDKAEALLRRGGVVPPSGAPTGNVVINGFNTGFTFPYMNFWKSWGASGSGPSLNGILPTVLNSNGYPNTTLSDNLGGPVWLPSNYAGQWVMKWTGTLSVIIAAAMTEVGSSGFLSGITFSGTNGRVVFTFDTPTSDTNTFFPAGYANSGVTNIVLCRIADETAIDNGAIFNPDFLSIMSTLNPKIIRQMGATLNSGNEALTNPLYAYQVPLSQMTYSTGTYPPGAWAGNTSGIDTLTCGSYPNMPVSWTGTEVFQANSPASGAVTITIATPAQVTLPISVVPGQIITLQSAGNLPAPFAKSRPSNPNAYSDTRTCYYALDSGTTTRLAATPGGAAIDTAGSCTSGTIASTVLTVAGTVTGTFWVGQTVTGAGVTAGTTIVSFGTGTGGAGTYNLSAGSTIPVGQTISSASTQSGSHSMGICTGFAITAVANNGSGLPRLTLPSTAALSTNQIVGVCAGVVGPFKITVVNSTQIDLVTSYPNNVPAIFGAGGKDWSVPGGSPIGVAYLTVATINVNSRGPKLITNAGAFPLSPGNLANVIGINLSGVNTYIYDSLLDVVIAGPGELYTGLSLTLQIALCNALNKDLWYEFGCMVTDATVTAQVNEIATTLHTNLSAYLAYSNETWNGFFSQFYYVLNRGIVLNFPYSGSGVFQINYTATGLRTLEIMQLATSAWVAAGRPKSKLKRVISCQAAGSTSLFQTFLLNGNDLPAPNNAAPNRPIDFSDDVTYANYWNGVLINGQYPTASASDYAELTAAADDYASGNPALMANAMNWVKGDLLGTNGTATPPGVNNFCVSTLAAGVFPAWEAVAASYDSARAGFTTALAPLDIVAYEGGPDIIPPNADACARIGISGTYAAKIFNLVVAFKTDPAASAMVQAACAAFVSASFPHNKNASFLQLEAGFPDGTDPWSLLPGDIYSTPYQLFNGAVAFNNSH